jgi:hypothetical protein
LATGAEEVRMHTPSRVGERVGGVHTANGVTSEGAISHVILGYARWCDRMIFVCLSVCHMNGNFSGLLFGKLGRRKWFMLVVKFRNAFARWLCLIMTWVYRDNH